MSRLLNAVLRFRGNARIAHYHQLNLNLSEFLTGAYNCSSWAANQSPAGRESSSAQRSTENKAQHNVDRDTREQERVINMRSRMRTLHGLDHENSTHDTLSQCQNRSSDGNSENDSGSLSFTFEPNDEVSSNIGATDEEGASRTQTDFIKRLKDGYLPRKKMDRLISAPFGLVRVDSMNSLQGRPKSSKMPEETTVEIRSIQKSGVKFGQSILKHDQSELKHGHREFKVDESGLKHDLSASKFESRQDQSEVKRSQSEFINDMSESHPESIISDLMNIKTMSTGNEASYSPVSSPSYQVPPQQASQKRTSDNPVPIRTNVFDQQYFHDATADDRNPEPQTQTSSSLSENVFEDQYFGKDNSSTEKPAQFPADVFETSAFSHSQNFSTEIAKPKKDHRVLSFKPNEPVDIDENSRSSVFDEQYFGQTGISNEPVEIGKNSRSSVFDEQYFGQTGKSNEPVEIEKNTRSSVFDEQTNKSQMSEKLENAKHNKVRLPKIRVAEVLPKLEKPDESEDTIFHEIVTKREIKQRSMPIANVENPTTAYDMAMKIRLEKKGKLTTPSAAAGTHPRDSKWSGKVDSKGFRILTEQVVDMQLLTENVVLNILKDSILYEDDNIIAIDKPYGLPSHGGPGVHHSVGKFLEPLAAKVDKTGQLTSLHLVHRLDKETTGVMVLAKSQQTAEFLLAMFKKRMVVKRYWAITKGIPNPTEGIIDIPMAEGSVKDRYRMELRPLYRDEASLMSRATNSLSGDRREAVTNYKVMSSANGTALVECQPETGVKHQIRCHLAFGLNTPILGDHKYSHYSKMAPQRLYPEILVRLGIRQGKVRHLPMHLHAKALVLPEFKDGRNLFLSARLPKHFVQNMKWLKLEPPQ